jgi:hypothetical protein
MAVMTNINDAIKKTRTKVITLKETISSNYVSPSGMVLSISNYLDEIEKYLLTEKLSKYKLDEYSFGIFRQVTDEYQFEKSQLGQGLLKLSVDLRELGKKL